MGGARRGLNVPHDVNSGAPLFAAFRFCATALLFLAATFWLPSAVALTQPKWADLSLPQQTALKPLAGEWDKLDDLRRRKWIAVAERYPSMKPEEQKRMQARMGDWARLSPEQRNQARETYKRTQAIPAARKKAEWQQYQTLPDAQKQRLAAAAEASKPAKQKARQREIEGKVVKPSPPVKTMPGSAAGARPPTPAAPLAPLPAPPASPVAPLAPPAN